MARPKKPAIELATLDDCTRAMGELLEARLELERLTTRRDTGIARLQARYEGPVDEQRKRAAGLEASLKAYYYAHLAELEKDGVKHVQLANGLMGRRDNPAKLVPLNRNWGWEAIKSAVREKFGWKYFQEPKERELDKEAIKAAKLAIEELKALGLKLDQDETFYVEPARLPAAEVVSGGAQG